MKAKLSVALDSDCIEKLDQIRGDAKRSTIINKIMRKEFGLAPPSLAI